MSCSRSSPPSTPVHSPSAFVLLQGPQLSVDTRQRYRQHNHGLYWGTELYPRILGIDLKQALVARYGIMLWALFALSFAFKSAELQNKSDGLPFGQSVSCALQVVYIGKFYYWERWYMHAADIQVDRYGFMMCWGPHASCRWSTPSKTCTSLDTLACRCLRGWRRPTWSSAIR